MAIFSPYVNPWVLMSTVLQSRSKAKVDVLHNNPFTPSSHATMTDLLAKIAADETLEVIRRRNLCSSIRSLGRLLSCDLAMLPAHPGHLRNRVNRLHPRHTGVSKKRLQNIKADVTFALRRTGWGRLPHPSRTPLAPAWRTVWSRLPDRSFKDALSRFMRYCSAQGLAPNVVNDDISRTFLAALEAESFVRDPRAHHRRMTKAWNKAADTVPGWPRTGLTVPSYRSPYTLRWEAFSRSFRDEVEAYLARASGADLFDKDAPERPLRPASITARRFQILQLASAAVHQGHDPGNITSLAHLVETARAKEMLRFFLDRSDGKSTSQIFGLAVALKLIAKHWVKVDAEHLAEFARICRRLNPKHLGLTEKNRLRLRQFDDPQNVAFLLDFPRAQLAVAHKADRSSRSVAVKVQIAIAVELLLMTPIRLGNLAALSLKRHIHWSGSTRRGVVHLIIPAAEVKNRENLVFKLPHETTSLLEAYLEHYRPRLLDGLSEWLFPGQDANHKHPSVLGTQIRQHLHQATGLEVNPHLFRHIGAKLYLDENPGAYEVVRRVLGHRSIDTTTAHYTGLETAAAARHFDDTILSLRRKLAAPEERHQ
jgi:integrase